MWIAPIPVLFASLITKPREAFVIAFAAYLIGRLSWLPYLLAVLPLPLAVIFTLLLPLIYALIVVGARKINLGSPHWLSILAFPVLLCAYEYIVFIFSPDGTATSMAYTQSNYLPIIQLSAVTGILGITFVMNLFASLITRALYERKSIRKSLGYAGAALFFVCLTIGYGRMRLITPVKGKKIEVGMVSIDEKSYAGTYSHDPAKEMQLTDLYLPEISKLADQGAKIILLPEKAIVVSDSTRPYILDKFSREASGKNVMLIVGVTHWKDGFYFNDAWVISADGKLLKDYQKNFLFAGEKADGCRPGKGAGLFLADSVQQGVAICKDMDFHQFILSYSKHSPAVLYAPAWDFKMDGWLHSRMAMLRSVEGGFYLLRNARDGRMTISDWRGKILYEGNTESGERTTMLGSFSLASHPTTYARAGDGFGTACLFAAFGFFLFMFRDKTSGYFARKREEEKLKRQQFKR